MQKHVKTFFKHPLISGSFVIFAGSFGANIFYYLFNLGAGRFLSVNDYRILISLTALITLIILFQGAWVQVFTKFAARFAHSKEGSERMLIVSGTKITFAVGALTFLVLLILINPISNYLHIHSPIVVVLMFLSVFFAIAYSLPTGILLGNLKFLWSSVFNLLGAVGKLLIGLWLLFLGVGLFGATIAVLFSFVVPYVTSMIYVLKKYNTPLQKKGDTNLHFYKEFRKMSGIFLIASIAITIIQGTDVIFASHYLNSIQAGQFAALSIMGKAIFYVTSPIYFVFFPLIAHKIERKEKTTGTLFLAGGIIFLCSSLLTLIYFFLPGLVLRIFFPSPAYHSLSPYLGLYSIYIMIFSFCYLFYNYFISTGKGGVYKINSIAAVFYIAALFFLHKTISQFILVLILSSFLLLILLLVYYFRNESY